MRSVSIRDIGTAVFIFNSKIELETMYKKAKTIRVCKKIVEMR